MNRPTTIVRSDWVFQLRSSGGTKLSGRGCEQARSVLEGSPDAGYFRRELIGLVVVGEVHFNGAGGELGEATASLTKRDSLLDHE